MLFKSPSCQKYGLLLLLSLIQFETPVFGQNQTPDTIYVHRFIEQVPVLMRGGEVAARKKIGRAGDEASTISHQMMPELLLQVGLVKAIRYGVDQLNEAENGIHFSFYNHVKFENINEVSGVVVYRSFQELINNMLKHAKARNVSIQLIISEDEVLLMVEDDGKGFDKNNGKYGLGLSYLESHIEIFDGRPTLDSTTNKGTTAILKLTPIKLITEPKYTDA